MSGAGVSRCPGAGKSTLAGEIVGAYSYPVVPMDGYHFADVELVRRGLLERKRAPEALNAEGHAAMLERVRARLDQVTVAPPSSVTSRS